MQFRRDETTLLLLCFCWVVRTKPLGWTPPPQLARGVVIKSSPMGKGVVSPLCVCFRVVLIFKIFKNGFLSFSFRYTPYVFNASCLHSVTGSDEPCNWCRLDSQCKKIFVGLHCASSAYDWLCDQVGLWIVWTRKRRMPVGRATLRQSWVGGRRCDP